MKIFVLSLTLFRIICAPFLLYFVIFLESYWLSFWLFNLAAFSDFLDGKLARKYNVVSRIGTILDPIGDKFLLLFSLVGVIILSQDNFVTFIGTLILGREFLVSALREYAGATRNSNLTSVTMIAKTKTAFQFIAISMCFLGAAANISLMNFLASFMLFVAMLLGTKSAITYAANIFKT